MIQHLKYQYHCSTAGTFSRRRTIANAHAEYVIRNMRTALQHRGKSEVRLAWWNGNADHPRLYTDPLTNAVIHVEESANGHSGLGGLAGDP